MKDTKEIEALKDEEWDKVNYVFTDKYLDMSRNVKEQTIQGIKNHFDDLLTSIVPLVKW